MSIQTLNTLSPWISIVIFLLTVAVGWGKLRSKFDNLKTEHVKLINELKTANGRTTYVTRTECGVDQNKIVTEISSLGKRIDDRNAKQDEKWEKVLLHMGKVQQFMEVKK